SWWNWYYGDSYGSRVMIEFLSLFILLFALSLSKLSTRWQQSSVIIASLFIVLNIFQTYQYYYQILSYFDMNTEKYIYTFGKFGEENRQILGGNNDIIQYHTSGTSIILKDYKLSNNHKPGYYHNLEVLLSGKQLANYSSSYLQLSCKTEIIQNVLSKVNWQISYTDSLKNVITSTYFKINEIPLIPGESRFNNYAIRLPKPIFASDNYIIKISNTTNTEFILSDIKITLKGIK
ncbi:MAG: hypothetical protein KAG84_08625, partial [Bacteroidales bacterium]|nr:hypothetical protein [Bacteroidales bacterium]